MGWPGRAETGGSLDRGNNSDKIHRVQIVRHLTDSAFVLRVDRHGVRALAGQCCTLGVAGRDLNREYSLYSGTDDPYFEFLVKEVEGGQVSTALKNCRVGDPVEVNGPYGKFIIEEPEHSSHKYLFVATGVGIAPFHGFVSSYPHLDYTLIHGVRYLEERYDMQDYERVRYIGCVSRQQGGDFRGRVTDYLNKNPVDLQAFCYICGSSTMVQEVFNILRNQQVNPDRLFTEAFF